MGRNVYPHDRVVGDFASDLMAQHGTTRLNTWSTWCVGMESMSASCDCEKPSLLRRFFISCGLVTNDELGASFLNEK